MEAVGPMPQEWGGSPFSSLDALAKKFNDHLPDNSHLSAIVDDDGKLKITRPYLEGKDLKWTVSKKYQEAINTGDFNKVISNAEVRFKTSEAALAQIIKLTKDFEYIHLTLNEEGGKVFKFNTLLKDESRLKGHIQEGNSLTKLTSNGHLATKYLHLFNENLLCQIKHSPVIPAGTLLSRVSVSDFSLPGNSKEESRLKSAKNSEESSSTIELVNSLGIIKRPHKKSTDLNLLFDSPDTNPHIKILLSAYEKLDKYKSEINDLLQTNFFGNLQEIEEAFIEISQSQDNEEEDIEDLIKDLDTMLQEVFKNLLEEKIIKNSSYHKIIENIQKSL